MAKDHRLTAIIYDKRKRILSVGQNSYVKTNTQMFLFGRKFGIVNRIYLHAEADAILKLSYSERDRARTIFISRYSSFDNRPMLAKPCEICQEMITKMLPNIKNIIWTETE
jgi:deoxycytidylate deaminase